MARLRRTEIQVVDFFSGCGGMSYGFATAPTTFLNFKIKAGVEIDPHANATFRRMLQVDPTQIDIRELRNSRVLDRYLQQWQIDAKQPLIVIGCAPCQGFSSHRKKDPRNDDRNSLLEVFGSICCRMQPDLIVMENVPEMLQRKHWTHFAAWRKMLAMAGYSIRVRIYNLAQFGVPQERFRAVVIAARDWNHFSMPLPLRRPQDFVTVRHAIGHLPALSAGQSDPLDPMHITSRHRPQTVALIKRIPINGGSRRALPNGFGPPCLQKVDGFRDVYGRLFWEQPAVAITARCRTPSCGRYVHPQQHRGLSVREAALLQGFPSDYFFEGPFDDKFKQIGNAVSPTFSQQLALHIDREWRLSHNHNHPSDFDDPKWDITRPIEKSFSSSIASIKRKMREQPMEHAFV